MLNIRDLKIDNASLGDKLLLVEVVPVYEYKVFGSGENSHAQVGKK